MSVMMPEYRDRQEHAETMIAAIRAATDPGRLVLEHLSRHGSVPTRGAAVGKASVAMAAAVGRHGGAWRGPIVAPHGAALPREEEMSGQVVRAGHPLPDGASVRAGGLVVDAIRAASTDRAGGAMTFLLSGGASALMVQPAEGITLEEYRTVVSALLRAGASIQELNAVRKHIDVLKGGGLARRASPAQVDVLVLSDVIGDDLAVIGSGPFWPDPTTYADALDVLRRRGCEDAAPAVTERMRSGVRGEHPETPKPGNAMFDRVHTAIIGSNRTAVDAAADAARGLGFAVATRLGVVGEAADAGRELARAVLEASASGRGARAVVWGGETTVTVGSADGVGGRNQELALAAAVELAGHERVAVLTFSTDGVDGPTDAAGGMVTGETVGASSRMGLDAGGCLARHDSHTYLAALRGGGGGNGGAGGVIRTGATGTNVNDVAIGVVYTRE